MCKRICLGIVLYASWLAWSGSASAAPESIKIYTFRSYLQCDDTCAATVYGGPLAEINLTVGQTQSWFFGGTLSRVLIEFDKYATIEGEIGIGKRFGQLREAEIWNGYTFRWKYFPWNKYVVTTIGLTAGVSYASGIANYELGQSVVGHGARLLGFLSPEVTLAFHRIRIGN